MSVPQGVLNVREPLIINGNEIPEAIGDGCIDDTEPIQARLDLLAHSNRPSGCNPPPLPYYSGVYFPPGIYRLTDALTIPYAKGFRIYGEAPGDYPDGGIGVGSVFRQDGVGKAILVFEGDGSSNWTIENLGFRWQTQQEPPPGWNGGNPIYNTYIDPGAVAILFKGDPAYILNGGATSYYHGRISNCFFRQGWRGVAIDDAFPYRQVPNGGFTVSPWNIQIDQCRFYFFRGAAISLFQRPGQWTGKPNNAVLSTYVDNVHRDNLPFDPSNIEPQLRFSTSSSVRLDGVDLEGSRTTVIEATQSVMTLKNVHIEHVKIGPVEGGFPRLFEFIGGTYAIQGMTLDGAMNAKKLENTDRTESHLIYAGDDTEVVLSGLKGVPFPHTVNNLNDGGGFIPINGDAQLFAMNADHIGDFNTRFYLLDRPVMPVRPDSERTVWDTANTPNTYDQLLTYPEALSLRVRTPLVKAKKTINVPGLAVGASYSVTVTVEGATVGDVVQLGLPVLPAGYVTTAFVKQDDLVEIRFANLGTSAGSSSNKTLTVLVGDGPEAGRAQVTTKSALLVPGYPSHELPDVS